MDILCFKVADSSAVFRANDFTVIKCRSSHKMNQAHLWEAHDFITVKYLALKTGEESATLKHKISTMKYPITFKSFLGYKYGTLVQEKKYSGNVVRILAAGDSLRHFFQPFFLVWCTHLPPGARCIMMVRCIFSLTKKVFFPFWICFT